MFVSNVGLGWTDLGRRFKLVHELNILKVLREVVKRLVGFGNTTELEPYQQQALLKSLLNYNSVICEFSFD